MVWVGGEVEEGEVACAGEAELKDGGDPGAVERAEGLELGEGAVGALVAGAADLEGGLCVVLHVADEEGGALCAGAEGGVEAVAPCEESFHGGAPLVTKTWGRIKYLHDKIKWSALFCHSFCRLGGVVEVVWVGIVGVVVGLVWRLLGGGVGVVSWRRRVVEGRVMELARWEWEVLGRRFVLGEAGAFEAVYGALYGVVAARAGVILGDRAEGEDVAQEAFLRAWRWRGSLREPGRLRGWVWRIAVHVALGRASRGVVVLVGGEVEAVADAAASPEEALELSRSRRRLRAAVEGLSPRQREVVRLRSQEGLPFAEIARRLSCSGGAARVNYVYGVRRLREALAA